VIIRYKSKNWWDLLPDHRPYFDEIFTKNQKSLDFGIVPKIVPHFFRAWATYTLQINGLNPSIIDYVRGDVANTIRGFYFNQVLPFEVIKKEYLRCVPKFGI